MWNWRVTCYCCVANLKSKELRRLCHSWFIPYHLPNLLDLGPKTVAQMVHAQQLPSLVIGVGLCRSPGVPHRSACVLCLSQGSYEVVLMYISVPAHGVGAFRQVAQSLVGRVVYAAARL